MATTTRGKTQRPALITSARLSTSLDTGQRQKRYLITMTVRVLCFLGAPFAPLPYNLLLIAGAAILPAIAVLLANAVDRRTPSVGGPAAGVDTTRPALPSPHTLSGTVVDDD